MEFKELLDQDCLSNAYVVFQVNLILMKGININSSLQEHL